MSQHRILRKRDDFLTGSVVVSIPSPTDSSLLAQNTPVSGNSDSTVAIPLVSSSGPSSSAATTQSPTPTASASTHSASSSNQISLGTVIGTCIASLIALVLAVLLAFYCSKRHKQSSLHSKSRNAANNASRRRSHMEPWKRMKDHAGRQESGEQDMAQRPPSGTLGAMFHRTLSSTSAEKSSETHNRESVGTMQHFAKYHPGLAAEMASQGSAKRVDVKITQPPPVLRLVGHGSDANPPLSWDGETVRGESYMSLHSSMNSSTVATAKATPPAMSSYPHRWESAEVVHVDSDLSGDGGLHNPFADERSSLKSRRSSTKGRNPFFSGRDHPVRRTVLPETPKNPFSETHVPNDSSAAIQSLIAALQEPNSSDRAVSMQSSLYSGMTADDGESAVSVTAFPYPPAQLNVR